VPGEVSFDVIDLHADRRDGICQLLFRYAQGLGPVAQFPILMDIDALSIPRLSILKIVRHGVFLSVRLFRLR